MGSDEKPLTEPSVQEELEDDEEEEEYVVEQILKHKITKKNKVEFFLKWKGFSPEDNTWEPAENLNCPELIDAYLKDVNDKEKGKVRAIVGGGEENEKIVKAPGALINGNTSEEKKSKQQKRKTTDENPPKKKKKSEKRVTGFDKGLEAEEILGATETSGEVHFLIKWKGMNDAELVPSKIANVKIPQMVIAFYEARLTWSAVSGKSSDETEDQETEEPKKEEKEDIKPITAPEIAAN